MATEISHVTYHYTIWCNGCHATVHQDNSDASPPGWKRIKHRHAYDTVSYEDICPKCQVKTQETVSSNSDDSML